MIPVPLMSCRSLLSLSSLTCRRYFSVLSTYDGCDIILSDTRGNLSSLTCAADRRLHQPVVASSDRIVRFSSLAAAPKYSYGAEHGFRTSDPETQRKRRAAKYAWSLGHRSPALAPRFKKLTADFLPLPASLVYGTGNICHCVGKDVLSSSSASEKSASGGAGTGGQPNKVPPEKLQHVFNELELNLPRFFVVTHPFNLYDKDMIFEDNIRGLVIKGRDAYMYNLIMLKMKAQICYGKITMNVLKMTAHPEDGTIRVRWQAEGVAGWRLMLTFWRYGWAQRFSDGKQQPVSDVTDGFSIFYLNSQGLIYKHMCDKMMPDTSGQENRVKDSKDPLPV